MQLDEPFPLEAIAPRVRRVILDEFQGHWPTVHEIAQISDRHWLATPGVGPGTLEAMRRITHPPRQPDDPNPPRLSDAALLDPAWFFEEFRWIPRTEDKNACNGKNRRSLPEPKPGVFRLRRLAFGATRESHKHGTLHGHPHRTRSVVGRA